MIGVILTIKANDHENKWYSLKRVSNLIGFCLRDIVIKRLMAMQTKNEKQAVGKNCRMNPET